MTDVVKKMNPLHFGSDPADIRTPGSPGSGSIQKTGFKSQVTFGWGNGSAALGVSARVLWVQSSYYYYTV